MQDFIDKVVLWYGGLPGPAQTAITVVVGAVLAYFAFKIAVRIVKRVVSAVITAVVVFLLTTVPGHMILTNAYEQLKDRVPSTLNVNQLDTGKLGGLIGEHLQN